jgi:hypothetical protein
MNPRTENFPQPPDKRENARWVRPGAEVGSTGRIYTTSCITTDGEPQYLPCSDECVWRLGRALRMGRLESGSWGFNFTRSILRHSKRRNWQPSNKQLGAMRCLLAELAEPVEDLIDGGDHAA